MRMMVAAVLLAVGLALPASAREPAGTVEIVEVGGALDRVAVGFLRERIAAVNARDAEALLVRLDTPGAVGVDLGALLDDLRRSEVPVVVWVGPAGATAAGGGFWIAQNAQVLALAPASVLGPALPRDLGHADGGAPPGVRPGRSIAFAAAAAGGAVAVGVPDGETGVPVLAQTPLPRGADRAQARTLDGQALAAGGIADFTASSLPQVLARLDGLQIAAGGGGGDDALEVDPQAANIRFVNMGLFDRVLHAVASPALAYLLFMGGALALWFEIFQPGFGVSGLTGIGLAGLGGYGLFVLPTGWGGVALLILGFVLLAADLALARLGWLSAAGAAALAVGSWLAFPVAALRPPGWLLASVAAFAVVFFAVIMTVVLRAQGNQALAGAQAVVGSVGVVRSVLNPEGHVFVRGALWRARAPAGAGRVKTGTKVQVLGMNDQLTLDVEVLTERDLPIESGAAPHAG